MATIRFGIQIEKICNELGIRNMQSGSRLYDKGLWIAYAIGATYFPCLITVYLLVFGVVSMHFRAIFAFIADFYFFSPEKRFDSSCRSSRIIILTLMQSSFDSFSRRFKYRLMS